MKLLEDNVDEILVDKIDHVEKNLIGTKEIMQIVEDEVEMNLVKH